MSDNSINFDNKKNLKKRLLQQKQKNIQYRQYRC